mmetsp:Transcript_10708/g.17520  ORF Transcript_10708/g.17520 Transcript_10708/m.17520 type:complete len:232 (+) Transcript_10708:14450-15145(+)
MELGGRWGQLRKNAGVQLEGELRQLFPCFEYFRRECGKMLGQDAVVDVGQSSVGWEGNAEDCEERYETRVDGITSASWRTHRCNHTHVSQVLPEQFLATIIHAASLHQQLEQSDRLLGAISVHQRHVQVVDESDQSLAHWRAIRVLGALFNVVLQNTLDVQRGSSTGEVDVEDLRLVLVHLAQVVLDRHRLGSARRTHKQQRLVYSDNHIQQERVAHGVGGGDENLGELPV